MAQMSCLDAISTLLRVTKVPSTMDIRPRVDDGSFQGFGSSNRPDLAQKSWRQFGVDRGVTWRCQARPLPIIRSGPSWVSRANVGCPRLPQCPSPSFTVGQHFRPEVQCEGLPSHAGRTSPDPWIAFFLAMSFDSSIFNCFAENPKINNDDQHD